jgi:hypothetical protein
VRKHRIIRARGVRKTRPDVRRLSRAIIELAQAQAEAEAQATHRQKPGANASGSSSRRTDRSPSPAETSTRNVTPPTGDAGGHGEPM